jgi:hypothetical protein
LRASETALKKMAAGVAAQKLLRNAVNVDGRPGTAAGEEDLETRVDWVMAVP